ncbi:hypothetical protein DFO67_11657 [Modicisalibacter xianhensis]|uniref:Uncharacterized protein n=1 Tax=Modicisalibacter xianhensis TaxID=442341 RepID=A0A4R8FJ85_9GAMM|nr:hypothetical protein DFO67_11657 [Halomonas xianhensis]
MSAFSTCVVSETTLTFWDAVSFKRWSARLACPSRWVSPRHVPWPNWPIAAPRACQTIPRSACGRMRRPPNSAGICTSSRLSGASDDATLSQCRHLAAQPSCPTTPGGPVASRYRLPEAGSHAGRPVPAPWQPGLAVRVARARPTGSADACLGCLQTAVWPRFTHTGIALRQRHMADEQPVSLAVLHDPVG